jgi:NADH-quinone oxidoreductase subunit A
VTQADPVFLLGVFAVLAIGGPAASLVVARLVAPHNPGRVKQSPYECGAEEAGDPWGQFRIQFYLYALVFLAFDVEALFLYPWAMVFKEAGPAGFVEAMLFVGILVLAWAYAWRHRALEWE